MYVKFSLNQFSIHTESLIEVYWVAHRLEWSLKYLIKNSYYATFPYISFEFVFSLLIKKKHLNAMKV